MSSNCDNSWNRPWSIPEIVDSASNWSLAGDAGLLKYLETFSENLLCKAEETNTNLNNLLEDLNTASLSLDVIKNEFSSLHNVQFVESRVYEEDETLPVDQQQENVKDTKITEEERTKGMKEAVLRGIEVIDKYYEKVQVPASDSEDETDFPSFVLRPKDPYIDRPLPYIIGTEDWHNKWHVGLLDSSSESETDRVSEKFSDSDSESDLPVQNRGQLQFKGISNSGSEADLSSRKNINPVANSTFDDSVKQPGIFGSSDSEENNSVPVQAPIANRNFAQELAAKLGNVIEQNTQVIEPEVNKKPIQNVAAAPNRIIGNIFSDEPPPIDEDDVKFGKSNIQGLFSRGGDLFDDLDNGGSLWNEKKVQDKPRFEAPKSKLPNLFDDEDDDIFNAGDSQPRHTAVGQNIPGSKKVTEGLFDDDSSEDDLFNERTNQPSISQPFLHPANKTTMPFFDDEPPEIETKPVASKEDSLKPKKPIGGVKIFEGADLFKHQKIGGLLKVRRQESSESSDKDENINTPKATAESPLKIRDKPQDLFSDFDDKSSVVKQTLNRTVKKDDNKENNLPKESVLKKPSVAGANVEKNLKQLSLFDDDVEDESEGLFGDDLFSNISTKKFTSSLFEEKPLGDDLFAKADVSKKSMSSNADLFAKTDIDERSKPSSDDLFTKPDVDKRSKPSRDDLFTKTDVDEMIKPSSDDLFTKPDVDRRSKPSSDNLFTKPDVDKRSKPSRDGLFTKSDVDKGDKPSSDDLFTKADVDKRSKLSRDGLFTKSDVDKGDKPSSDDLFTKADVDKRSKKLSRDDLFAKSDVDERNKPSSDDLFTKPDVDKRSKPSRDDLFTKTDVDEMIKPSSDDLFTKPDVDRSKPSRDDLFTKTDVDEMIKPSSDDLFTKPDVDRSKPSSDDLFTKPDVDKRSKPSRDGLFTKSDVDKGDKPSSDDLFTKVDVDNKRSKLSRDDLFTKSDVDERNKPSSDDLFTKPDIDRRSKPSRDDLFAKTDVDEMSKPSSDDLFTKPDVEKRSKPSRDDLFAKTDDERNKPSRDDLFAKPDINERSKSSRDDLFAKTDVDERSKPSKADVDKKSKPRDNLFAGVGKPASTDLPVKPNVGELNKSTANSSQLFSDDEPVEEQISATKDSLKQVPKEPGNSKAANFFSVDSDDDDLFSTSKITKLAQNTTAPVAAPRSMKTDSTSKTISKIVESSKIQNDEIENVGAENNAQDGLFKTGPGSVSINFFDQNPPDDDDDGWDTKSENNVFEDNDTTLFDNTPEISSHRSGLFDNEPPSLFYESSGIVRDISTRVETDDSFNPYASSSRRFSSDIFNEQQSSDSFFVTKNKSHLEPQPALGSIQESLNPQGKGFSYSNVDITPSGNIDDLLPDSAISVTGTSLPTQSEISEDLQDDNKSESSDKLFGEPSSSDSDLFAPSEKVTKPDILKAFQKDVEKVESKPLEITKTKPPVTSKPSSSAKKDERTDNTAACPQGSATPKLGSPGKLKHNLNINVGALLPGVSPPKRKDMEKSSSSEATSSYETNASEVSSKSLSPSSSKSSEELPQDEPQKLVDAPANFESTSSLPEVLPSITKDRVRIPVKRRPSTRKARQESIRNSGIDFKINVASEEILKTQEDTKAAETLEASLPTENLFEEPKQVNSKAVETLEASLPTENLFEKPKEVPKKDLSVKNKEQLHKPDVHLFDDPVESDSLFTDNISSSISVEPPKKTKDGNSKNTEGHPTSSMFAEEKRSVINSDSFESADFKKSDLFDDSEEFDDIFSSRKLPPKSNLLKKSLFDDEDDDDIFGSSSSNERSALVKGISESKAPQKKSAKVTQLKKLENTAAVEDPLSAFND